MADLRLNINGQNNAGPALNEAAGGVKSLSSEVAKGTAIFEIFNKALSASIDFAKESLRAYEDQAKADRQLARVAGESTEAFKRQAAALQESLGVSDDMVETMQKMLLTYGEAPAEVDKTVRAILNLSAATGEDAVSAVSALTSATTTGRAAFKDLGIEYDKTGSRSQVLSSATEALAKKFAGSSSAEADSLSGSLAKAKQQFGEMQEAFGGIIAEIAKKTGVIESATWAFKQLADAMNPSATTRQQQKVGLLQDLQKELKAYEDQEKAGEILSFQGKSRVELIRGQIKGLLVEVEGIQREIKAAAGPLATVGPADKVLAGNHSGDAAAAAKKAKDIEADRVRNQIDAEDYALSLQRKYAEAGAAVEKRAEEESDSDFKKANEERLKAQKKQAEEMAKLQKQAGEHAEKQAEQNARALEMQKEQWAHAGMAIGMAFANALSDSLATLEKGGELDAQETALDVISSVLQVAGQVIGSIYGGEAGGMLGGLIGKTAGTGIKAIAHSESNRGKNKKRHGGGWALDEMPHYHSGTWVGGDEEAAILQAGERVLSRGEVQNMGGPRGVESAARGGGGAVNVTVNTLDGASAAEYFENRGGRALRDAMRSGRGVSAHVFGGR